MQVSKCPNLKHVWNKLDSWNYHFWYLPEPIYFNHFNMKHPVTKCFLSAVLFVKKSINIKQASKNIIVEKGSLNFYIPILFGFFYPFSTWTFLSLFCLDFFLLGSSTSTYFWLILISFPMVSIYFSSSIGSFLFFRSLDYLFSFNIWISTIKFPKGKYDGNIQSH